MSFVSRVGELAQLGDWWDRQTPQPALVWGRRRVGKTALISEFARRTGARTVFHIGGSRALSAELRALSIRVGDIAPANARDLDRRPYADWDDALEHLAAIATAKPLLVILDEFPELMHSCPELPGILRAFLDRPQGIGALRLLLCGSAVRTMWSMQEYRAPLYGRFDLSLQVHPFRPHEAAMMLPDLTPGDRAFVYGLLGGTPQYLTWWDQEQPLRDNLLRLAGRPGSRLLTEGELVLATEADAGEYPAAVLEAIATGKTRHHEISDAIGADPSRTIRQLTKLRLLERIIPITDSERRSNRRIYRIADPFLRFYLGPLQRYRAEIERGAAADIVDALLDALSEHLGETYEESFRMHLRQRAAAGDLGPRVVAIGPWWREGGQDQIDAVVLAEPNRTRIPILVGEAKWAAKVDGRKALATLRHKAARLTERPDDLRYVICAREQVTRLPADALSVTASDIFPDP